MKKMTDEEKINRAKYYNGMVDADKLDAIRDVCDYYDAQIDAQAKTMEELAKIYLKNIGDDPASDHHKFYTYIRCIISDNEVMSGVMLFLDGFFASGGVIKE
jgi:hypothetical protein